jgi:hypothetical protein
MVGAAQVGCVRDYYRRNYAGREAVTLRHATGRDGDCGRPKVRCTRRGDIAEVVRTPSGAFRGAG